MGLEEAPTFGLREDALLLSNSVTVSGIVTTVPGPEAKHLLRAQNKPHKIKKNKQKEKKGMPTVWGDKGTFLGIPRPMSGEKFASAGMCLATRDPLWRNQESCTKREKGTVKTLRAQREPGENESELCREDSLLVEVVLKRRRMVRKKRRQSL